MTDQVPFFLRKLRAEFEARTNRKPGYSLRAFAKYLGVEAPSLSNVMKGNRRIPKTKIERIAERLNLSPEEKVLFVQSNRSPVKIGRDTTFTDIPRYNLDSETHFRVISEWEHYAVLSLAETKGFKSNTKWIGERLGISASRAQICVENLLHVNLMRLENNRLILTHKGLQTTEDVPSKALRKARKQDLEMALDAIDEISVDLRDFSSCTMTLNPSDLPELKRAIRDFRRRFMKQTEQSPGLEVYKLAVQLFPLTNLRSSNENN